MAQPQGFRTFQILLAIGFLTGFFALLLFFFWKISDLNSDLNRIQVVNQVKERISRTLQDARTCELNFAGLTLENTPISLRKIVDIRKEAIIRIDKKVNESNIILSSLRLIPRHPANTGSHKNTKFSLEMVFVDDMSTGRSPVELRLTGRGRYFDNSSFQLESCYMALSDLKD